MVSGRPFGLGVIGAGRIGAVHARNAARMLPDTRLVGVADIDGAAAERVAHDIGAGAAVTIDALLADQDVDGVVIATPTGTHAALIATASAAGKHIFCEKPVALRLDATRDAIANAAKGRVLLQVGFQRRFDEDFARARDDVRSGRLGDVRFLRLVGRDYRMPPMGYLRSSGGQYVDQMIHEFDAARWLLAPREPVEVYAMGSALIDPQIAQFGDVDTAIACVRFDDGALAVIDASRETAYGYDARAEIQGSSGMAFVGVDRFAGRRFVDGDLLTPDATSFIERFAGAYRAELADFVSAARERKAPGAGGADALEALRLAMAADRSLRERRPVRVQDVDRD